MASFSDHNTTMNASTLTPDMRFLVTMDYVTPDTLTTGRVYMTFWDARKILKERWYAHRGTYHGSKSKDGKRNGHGKCFFLDKSTFDGKPVGKRNHICLNAWSRGHAQAEYSRFASALYTLLQLSSFWFCGACLGCPGEWVNDDRHGHGKQEYRDGSIYDGTWVEDERAGEGRSEYPDHSRYDGRCNCS